MKEDVEPAPQAGRERCAGFVPYFTQFLVLFS